MGTILAFDYGKKRVGVAVGESSLATIHPLQTITYKNKNALFEKISTLFKEWKPVLLVVGKPTYADGNSHEMTRACEKFANALQEQFGLDVALVDERWTSVEAENLLQSSSSKTKENIDAVAAQEILRTYFSDYAR